MKQCTELRSCGHVAVALLLLDGYTASASFLSVIFLLGMVGSLLVTEQGLYV